MNAVIYTKDDREYASMAGILKEESDSMDVFRDPLDGHGHYDYRYDMIVVALEGAKGMNTDTRLHSKPSLPGQTNWSKSTTRTGRRS